MLITIEPYKQKITAELMALLLMADPNKHAISAYLPNAAILVAKNQTTLAGVAVLTHEHSTFELKNIAVKETHQGKGIAKTLISHTKHLAKQMGATLIEVGTGNSSLDQLALYQKCGFRLHRIKPDYFSSYPTPIYEKGIRCRDLVILRASL